MATPKQNTGGFTQEQAAGVQKIYKQKLSQGLTPDEARAAIKADPGFEKAKAIYQQTPAVPVIPPSTDVEPLLIAQPPISAPTTPVSTPQATTTPKTSESVAIAQKTPVSAIPTPNVEKTTTTTPEGKTVVQKETPGVVTPDWNVGKGREQDILNNLNEGARNDPAISKALVTGDYNSFKQAYGYDTADSTKKQILDGYFQARQPKNSESFFATLAQGMKIENSKYRESGEARDAQHRYDIISPYKGANVDTLYNGMVGGTITPGSKAYKDLITANGGVETPDMILAKQKLESKRSIDKVNESLRAMSDARSGKETTNKEDVTQTISDKFVREKGQSWAEKYKEAVSNDPETIQIAEQIKRDSLRKKEIERIRSDIFKNIVKNNPGMTMGAANLKAKYESEGFDEEYNNLIDTLNVNSADLRYKTSMLEKSFDYDYKEAQQQEQRMYEAQQAETQFGRQKELATFQQDLALAGNVKEFEQKLAQQAKLASDPYTAISTVMEQYQKLGVPFTQSIATKVADANAFIASGGTIGGYVDKMIKDIQSKPEYKAIQTEKFQQKPISVGKDSYIYDPVTKTFSSPLGKLDKTTTSSLLTTPDGIGNFTTQRKNSEGIMSENIQCGMLVNDWYRSVTGESAGIGDSYSDKLGVVKRLGVVDTPEIGSIFVSNPLKNNVGHTGIVQSVNPDGSIVVREANREGLETGGPAVTSTYSKKKADEMMFAKSPSTSSKSGLKDLGEYLIDTMERSKLSENDAEANEAAIRKYVELGDEETVLQLFRNKIFIKPANEALVQGSASVLNNISTLSKDIQDYVAKSGDTSLFKGTIEQIQNKLGETGDPALASIANRIGMLTADYIKEISGTAASDPEVQRLIALLPSTKTTVTLNDIYLKNFDQKVRNRAQSSMEVSIGNKYKNLAPKIFPELYIPSSQSSPQTVKTEGRTYSREELLNLAK